VHYMVTNAVGCPPLEVLRRQKSRWEAEESFRDAKQLAGLEAPQARVPQAAEGHVALVLLSLVALQVLRKDPSETAGRVKGRFQLLAIAPTPEPVLAT
jgi:SRSO17 transposase